MSAATKSRKIIIPGSKVGALANRFAVRGRASFVHFPTVLRDRLAL
jgi:hypothetical protein